MKLADCEVSHRHVRGHNVAFLFGSRALSGAECAALLAEWHQAYGPDASPAYASPAGWQALDAQDQVGPVASLLRVDEDREVIEFDGVKFSAELLRTFSTPTPDGFAFRVLSVDGVTTISRIELPATQAAEEPDPAAGAPAPVDAEAGAAAPPAPARKTAANKKAT